MKIHTVEIWHVRQFEELKLDRIVAVAWPDNIISRRVMDGLGMKYVKMAHYYHAEVVYYAISRQEYLSLGRQHT